MQLYRVGGAVRDELLGLPVSDQDWVVVGATPQQMEQLGYRPVGRDFPVFLHPKTAEEYALARTERKQGRGYKGFTVCADVDVTLEEDLLRRDLTINAMAQSADGELIDPWGGLEDLRARRLKAVSAAFAEDPLRVLRTARFAARFAQLGFVVEENTLQMMAQLVASGELLELKKERIWIEVEKALTSTKPSVFFCVLQQLHAIEQLWPALAVQLQRAPEVLDCLDQAAAVGLSQVQRLAVLGWFAQEEEVEQLAEDLLLPKQYQQQLLALVRVKSHPGLLARNAEEVMALFDRLDAWRHPELFATTLQLVTLLESINTAATLQVFLSEAQAIKAAALVQQGLKGTEVGVALKKQRLAFLQQQIRSQQQVNPEVDH